MKYYKLIIVAAIISFSCKKSPKLDSFNQEVWKKDNFGCQSKRKEFIPTLKPQFSKIIGLHTSQLIPLLGRPDQEVLLEKGERFYRYYYKMGIHCSRKDFPDSLFLRVRFSSIGLVNELTIF